MKDIGSRVTRMEDHLKKIIEQSKLNISELWKRLDPDDLNMMENAVETFRENFGDRFIQNDLVIIPEDASFEERNKLLLTNFSNIVVGLILSMHRASLGSLSDNTFLQNIRKDENLTIALKYAEDASSSA